MRTVIQPGVRGLPVLIPAIGTVALFICAWTALSSSHFLSVHNVCTCLMNIYPCSSRKQRLFACIWIFVHDRCVWVGKGGGGNVCCICLKLKFISHHGTTVPLWTIESFSHALFNILLSFTIIYHKFIIISNSRLNLVIRKIAPRKIVYSVWWYSMVSTLDGIRNSRHNPVIRLSSLRKIVYFIQWCLWLQQLMASCLLLSYSFSAYYFYSSMNLLHCFVENISCKCIHPFLPL